MPHPLLWWIKRAVITDINLFHIIFHATWAVLHLFNLRFIWFLLQVSFHPLWNRRHIALTWRGDSGDVKVRKVCVIYGPHDRALTIAITRNLPVYIDVVGWRVSDRKSYIRWPLAPILPPPLLLLRFPRFVHHILPSFFFIALDILPRFIGFVLRLLTAMHHVKPALMA